MRIEHALRAVYNRTRTVWTSTVSSLLAFQLPHWFRSIVKRKPVVHVPVAIVALVFRAEDYSLSREMKSVSVATQC